MPILTQKHHSSHHDHVRKLEILFIAVAILAIITSSVSSFFVYKSLHASKQSSAGAQKPLTVTTAESQLGTVRSKLGFSVKFNKELFKADATVIKPDASVEQFTDSEVFQTNDYAILNVYKRNKDNKKIAKGDDELSELTLSTNVHKDFFDRQKAKYGDLSQLDLTERSFSPISSDTLAYTLVNKTDQTIGSTSYRKLEFNEESKQLSGLGTKVKPLKTYVYVTVQNNRPYAVTISGLSPNSPNLAAYQQILSGITYSSPDSDAQFSLNRTEDSGVQAKLHSLLSSLWGHVVPHAYAADSTKNTTKTQSVDAETIKVVAANTPAVVQVGSAYCSAVELNDGQYSVQLPEACVAATGSGFLLSSDGYIGTNGHVVKFTPNDLVAENWLEANPDIIVPVAAFILGTNDKNAINAFLTKVSKDQQAILQIADAIEQENPQVFKAKNETSQYAIKLGAEPLKFNQGDPAHIFSYDKGVIKAELKDLDFNSRDLFSATGFTASDVAILKVDGDNYPYVQMGSIDGLVQGAPLTVIGYPGLADQNGLTDASTSQATATKGIVSAIREATGNHKKLIQSDVSIDHGNSGGPVFNENGEVVGLATYGIKLSDTSGTFNYMRDIKDLKDLLAKSNITLIQKSKTQDEWNKGLNNFLKAHYHSAVKNFKAVLAVYPEHSLAQKYIDVANDKIAHGEEATNSTLLIILVSASVLLVGGGVTIFILVIRHRRRLKGVGLYPSAQAGASPTPGQPTVPPAVGTTTTEASYPWATTPPIAPQSPAPSPQSADNSQPVSSSMPQQVVPPSQPISGEANDPGQTPRANN
jgi:S1-C subfamily serine protease/flagellar basal body-associated protein FliL